MITLGRFGGVHQLQPVDVFDIATSNDTRQACAITLHVHLERRAQGQAQSDCQYHRTEDGAINQHTRAQDVGPSLRARPVLLQGILRGVAYEAARVPHLVHHRVAHIDAGGAADAFVLQTLPDVDAGRADLYTQRAVDTRTQIQRRQVGLA